MKHKILAGIIVGLTLSTLIGCGKDKEKKEPTEAEIKIAVIGVLLSRPD